MRGLFLDGTNLRHTEFILSRQERSNDRLLIVTHRHSLLKRLPCGHWRQRQASCVSIEQRYRHSSSCHLTAGTRGEIGKVIFFESQLLGVVLGDPITLQAFVGI